MDPQLKAQCAETINVATISGADAAGDFSYNAAGSMAARVVNVEETHERIDGTIVKTTVTIITENEIKLSDRVWLPGANPATASLARVPRFIEKAINERGAVDFFRTKL
tara:strand:+ start:247 stop:573 length:327 start_codon:yes stop_codon:yes gene_type:complete